MQFALAVPDEMNISHMALSRDGSMLVFVSPEESSGVPMLYVQRIGSSSVTLLPGTQGASYPFWSPDGAYVAFFANSKLQKIAIAGGTPQVLATALAGTRRKLGKQRGDHLYPGCQNPIWRINADGTGMAQVTDIRKRGTKPPLAAFSSRRRTFLVLECQFREPQGRPREWHLRHLPRKQGEKTSALCQSSFGYDAHSLFYADAQRQLVSLPFDPATGTVSGSATMVANVVGHQPSTYWTALTVSQNGTLIYNTGVGAAQSALTWMDRSGKELGRIGEPAIMDNPTLSPDGTRVAVDISDQKANNVDIWIESTTGATNSRFTFDPAEEVVGVWSRDGSMVAYRS